MSWTDRTELLLGKSGVEALKNASVLICGLGGVGSYAAEAVARSGVGKIYLCDSDIIDETNINRQLYADTSTIGKPKVQLAAQKISLINPEAATEIYQLFLTKENISDFLENICQNGLDFIIDAVDNITVKTELAYKAQELGINIVSSMGTANKFDPSSFKTADIYETSVCPLAKAMRKLLKERGVKQLRVVYSTEQGIKSEKLGSLSFVPPAAGLLCAGEAVKCIVSKSKNGSIV